MQQGDHREKISRTLLRRPDPSDLRQYLFWLVDVIYACKATKDPALLEQAKLLEEAMGYFGSFMERGQQEDFAQLQAKLQAFAQFLAVPQPAGGQGHARA